MIFNIPKLKFEIEKIFDGAMAIGPPASHSMSNWKWIIENRLLIQNDQL